MVTKVDTLNRALPFGGTPSLPVGKPTGACAEVQDRFLAAVAPQQRPEVAALLGQRYHGGPGLRIWLRALAVQGASVPDHIPSELIDVYLTDPEALPLYDCSDCGLAIPARAGSRNGPDGQEDWPYFRTCPSCGGRTGLYAYWSNTARGTP
jgi:hypothetical protein